MVSLLTIVAAFLGACTSGDGGGPEPSGAVAAQPMPLDVFVYNVEYGGDESTDAVIESVDADIVGVLESYNRLPEMAENTGYPYYNVSLQILSKYPIHEPSGAQGRYAWIEVAPGKVVALFNIHLDYIKYGPRLLRNGAPVEGVIASENAIRTSALDVPLGLMEDLIADGYPVLFSGDHNEPSSLDWTEAAAAARPAIAQAVPWPVSEAILEAGFRDTYREIHPDPVEEPGITHQGAGDRIDYLYAAGPLETLDSKLVGEEGGRDVDVGFEPWTSDHRAVVSTFEVTPAPMPVMVSVDRALLTQGDLLTVAYHSLEPEGSVAIAPSGSDPDLTQAIDGASGTFEVDTSVLQPGSHDAVLRDPDGSEVARVTFWVEDPDARIRVSTDRRMYEVGEPVEVRWTDGPANRWDWIGIYEAAKSDPKVDYYLIWSYSQRHESGTAPPWVTGSLTMDETAQGRPWPLPPGTYVVHYLVTDRYRSIGSTRFRVV
jgi:hypothetical protein